MSFHLFIKTLSEERCYWYLSIYTKVPTTNTTVEVGEWPTLLMKVSTVSLSHDRFVLLLTFCVSCSSILPGRCTYTAPLCPMCTPFMWESLYTIHIRMVTCPHWMRLMPLADNQFGKLQVYLKGHDWQCIQFRWRGKCLSQRSYCWINPCIVTRASNLTWWSALDMMVK